MPIFRLLYSWQHCPYISHALFLAVLTLYFVRYIHSSSTLIFCTLSICPLRWCSHISYAIFRAIWSLAIKPRLISPVPPEAAARHKILGNQYESETYFEFNFFRPKGWIEHESRVFCGALFLLMWKGKKEEGLGNLFFPFVYYFFFFIQGESQEKKICVLHGLRLGNKTCSLSSYVCWLPLL